MSKQSRIDPYKMIVAPLVAEKHGIEINTVYKILRMERENEQVQNDYITGVEQLRDFSENLLLKAVNDLVPFK